MPPETLHDGISNEKTDIVSFIEKWHRFVDLIHILLLLFTQWSFGVTCWEVFSLGRTPYPGVQNYDMIKFVSTGGRLERPTLCPETLYVVKHAYQIELM